MRARGSRSPPSPNLYPRGGERGEQAMTEGTSDAFIAARTDSYFNRT